MSSYSEFRYVITRVYQQYGTDLPSGKEYPLFNVSFTQQLNSIGTFNGQMLMSAYPDTSYGMESSRSEIQPGLSALYVMYNDPVTLTSIPVWSGIIWGTEYNSENQTLTISAQEWMSIYQRRVIGVQLTYENEDPTSIANALIAYAEALPSGKTNVSIATAATTPFLVTHEYPSYEYKTVYQAIKDLSEGCFDFRMQPYNTGSTGAGLFNQFQTGYPLGLTVADNYDLIPRFEFPGNLVSYKATADGTSMTNSLYALGSGFDGEKLVIEAYNPYAVNLGPGNFGQKWPLLETTRNYIDIHSTNLLSDIAIGVVSSVCFPVQTFEIVLPTYNEPLYPSYHIGDECMLSIRDDYYKNNPFPEQYYRIIAITMQPGENGPSRVTLTLQNRETYAVTA